MSVTGDQPIQEQHSVLDLFPGKREGVFARMSEAIKRGLDKKVREVRRKLKHKVSDEKIIEAIAKKLYVNADRLKRIYKGEPIKGDVDYELFDRLEFSFDLSIRQVLEKPEDLNGNQEYWFGEFGQCRTHPIFPAWGVVKTIADNPKQQGDGKDLYLTLRAITELRGDNCR